MKLKEEGNAALRRGDAQSAVRFYDASLELEPKNAVVLNNRAQAHSNLGQWDKALEDSGECLAIESDNTKALFRSGVAKTNLRPRERSGIEDALADFKSAMSLNPPKIRSSCWQTRSLIASESSPRCRQREATPRRKGGSHGTPAPLPFERRVGAANSTKYI